MYILFLSYACVNGPAYFSVSAQKWKRMTHHAYPLNDDDDNIDM